MTNWLASRRTVRRVVPTPIRSLWNHSPLDRYLDDVWSNLESPPVTSALTFSPKVNVDDSDDELRLTAELPGLAEKDFEVTIDGDVLTINGEKKTERVAENDDRSVIERSEGSFSRSFRFAWDVDPDTVKAEYKNGVLGVVVPKPEEDQPQVRTIPVTTSDR